MSIEEEEHSGGSSNFFHGVWTRKGLDSGAPGLLCPVVCTDRRSLTLWASPSWGGGLWGAEDRWRDLVFSAWALALESTRHCHL